MKTLWRCIDGLRNTLTERIDYLNADPTRLHEVAFLEACVTDINAALALTGPRPTTVEARVLANLRATGFTTASTAGTTEANMRRLIQKGWVTKRGPGQVRKSDATEFGLTALGREVLSLRVKP